jgi:hypothetical protein
MIPVRERAQFAEAIKTKIIREIAGLVPEPSIVPVQAKMPTNCSAAENPYWDRN